MHLQHTVHRVEQICTVDVETEHLHIPVHTCTHTPAHAPAHAPAHTHTHTRARMQARTHACTHSHMHARTHTCMHALTHAHTHTHTSHLVLFPLLHIAKVVEMVLLCMQSAIYICRDSCFMWYSETADSQCYSQVMLSCKTSGFGNSHETDGHLGQ